MIKIKKPVYDFAVTINTQRYAPRIVPGDMLSLDNTRLPTKGNLCIALYKDDAIIGYYENETMLLRPTGNEPQPKHTYTNPT